MSAAAVRQGTLPRDGVTLHWWEHGDPDGAPLLLLHGATFDHRTWDEQTSAFAAAGHRVVTADLRGHGRSRPAPPFAVADAVGDVLALVDALALDGVVLIGQSMGGNIAQEVAARAPERVRALVALGCTCNTLGVSRAERLAGRLALGLIRWYPRRAYLRQVANGTAVTPQARRLIGEMIAPIPTAEAAAITWALVENVRDDPAARTPVPLLLVRGGEDRLGNIRTAMPAWAARDGAREVVIAGAGHAANQDDPAAFDRAVLAFLDGLPPVGAVRAAG